MKLKFVEPHFERHFAVNGFGCDESRGENTMLPLLGFQIKGVLKS